MGLEKVAVEHFNNMQAFLSEEFYINIFVETNIFLISTGHCFSWKYLSKFLPNSDYCTDPNSQKPSFFRLFEPS